MKHINNHVPVIYKGKPLAPTNSRRAHRLVEQGKAIPVYDKHLGWYIKLKVPPSDFNLPYLAIGLDTGTCYTGYSVVGETTSVNVEIEHTQRLKSKKNGKYRYFIDKSETRRMYRRIRRTRLRHRKARFQRRTRPKTTATENYLAQNILLWVKWLCEKYPVSAIVIEDTCSIHNKDNPGSAFSPMEQIKSRLYSGCKKLISTVYLSRANPREIRQFNMAEVRAESNSSIGGDFKLQDKSAKDFFAHCIDSHSLACLAFGQHLPFTEAILYAERNLPGIDANRRTLERQMSVRGSSLRRHSKFRKLRVKVNDWQGNHGPWIYMDATVSKYTKATSKSPYGSSIKISSSHCTPDVQKGDNKYRHYNKGQFEYWKISNYCSQQVSNLVPYYLVYEIPQESFGKLTEYNEEIYRELLREKQLVYQSSGI